MSTKAKKRILDEVLGASYKHGDECLYACPNCDHHKRKLSVNFSKNVFKCWVCDYSGKNLRRIVRKYGQFYHLRDWPELDEQEIRTLGADLFEPPAPEDEQQIQLPSEFCSLANKNLSISSLMSKSYLKERDISKKDITRWKIGYCNSGPYSDRIVVPSFGLSGHCNYFVARSYAGDWKKYMNPKVKKDIIFNELYLDWDSDLVIVEGVFDAIVAGPNSVPILGSSLRESSRLFKKIVENDTSVYLALDPDAEKKTRTIVKKLLEYGIEVRKINIAPYNDVGEMTKQEFKNHFDDAELITEDNYLLKTIMSLYP